MHDLIGQTNLDGRSLVGQLSLSILGQALLLAQRGRDCVTLIEVGSDISRSIQVDADLVFVDGEAARKMG